MAADFELACELGRHGFDTSEAMAYIDEHGVTRAAIWLRSCPVCKGRLPDSRYCTGSERRLVCECTDDPVVSAAERPDGIVVLLCSACGLEVAK